MKYISLPHLDIFQPERDRRVFQELEVSQPQVKVRQPHNQRLSGGVKVFLHIERVTQTSHDD